MHCKRKTEKRLGFPFLKTRSCNFQSFCHNLSQKLGVTYDEFGPLLIRIKKFICFEGFNMILLLQNFTNLKISPCSLDCGARIDIPTCAAIQTYSLLSASKVLRVVMKVLLAYFSSF